MTTFAGWQIYALEIGKDMGLSELELDALRAAALLHEIGKLAVPEQIISKLLQRWTVSTRSHLTGNTEEHCDLTRP